MPLFHSGKAGRRSELEREPEPAGRNAMFQPEEAGEVVPVREAGIQRNFPDGQVCGSQQVFRMSQPQILQIPLRRHAQFPPEQLQQIVRGDAQRAGNVGELQIRIVKLPVHHGLGLKENGVLLFPVTSFGRNGFLEGKGENAPQNGLSSRRRGESFHRLHEELPQCGEHDFPLLLLQQKVERKFREALRRRRRGNQFLVERFCCVRENVRHVHLFLSQTFAIPVDVEAPAFHAPLCIGIVQQAGRNEHQRTGVTMEALRFRRHPPAAAAHINQLIIIEPPVFFNPSGRPFAMPVHQALRMERFQYRIVSIYPANDRFLLYEFRFLCGII